MRLTPLSKCTEVKGEANNNRLDKSTREGNTTITQSNADLRKSLRP